MNLGTGVQSCDNCVLTSNTVDKCASWSSEEYPPTLQKVSAKKLRQLTFQQKHFYTNACSMSNKQEELEATIA